MYNICKTYIYANCKSTLISDDGACHNDRTWIFFANAKSCTHFKPSVTPDCVHASTACTNAIILTLL